MQEEGASILGARRVAAAAAGWRLIAGRKKVSGARGRGDG